MTTTTVIGISLFAIIFIVGVPGNSLIVWVFARKPRKTNTTWLIISLAVIDLAGCLIAPVHLVRSLGNGYINAIICKSSIYGSRLFSFSALYLTACIAVDRYLAVCKPLSRHRRPKLVASVILFCIALSVFGNLQFAIYVNAVALGPVIKKCLYRGGPGWLDLSNEIFTTVCFAVVFIICACVYVRIYLAIRKQMKVRAAGMSNMAGRGAAARRVSYMDTAFSVTADAATRITTACRDPTPNSRTANGPGDTVSNINHNDPGESLNDRGDANRSQNGENFNDPGESMNDRGGANRSQNGENLIHNGNEHNHLDVKGGAFLSLDAKVGQLDANGAKRPTSMHEAEPNVSTGTLNNPSAATEQQGMSSDSTMPRKEEGPPSLSSQNHAVQRKQDKPSVMSRQSKERLMTRMLLGTYLLLILSWIPSIILTNVPDKQVAAFRSKPSQGILVNLAYQLRTFNHIVNLFVYALLNKDFRKDCRAIFAKCVPRGLCAANPQGIIS